MNQAGPVFVLEVQGGHAIPASLRLEGGRRLDPISIGSQAQWPINGPAVRDVHGYLAFDGTTLYVQSANPLYPLRVEGSPVTSGWLPVGLPARIQVGGVTLLYVAAQQPGAESGPGAPETHRLPTAQDQEATRYNPIEIPEPMRDEMATRVDVSMFETRDDDATRPGVPLDEDVSEFDKTRVNYDSAALAAASQADLAPPTRPVGFAPVPVPIAGANGPATDPAPPMFPPGYVAPRPAAGMPAIPAQPAVPAFPGQPGTMQQQPLSPAEQLSRTRPGAPPAAILDLPPPVPAPTVKIKRGDVKEQAKELLKKFKEQWKEVSLPKKVVLILMPFCFVAIFVLFDDKGRGENAAPPHPAASASAAAASATTAAPRATPSPSSPAPPPPSTAAQPQAAATPSPPPPAAPPPPPSAPPAAPAPLPPGGKTAERLAVDAVVAGTFADAAQRYEALAREHPDQPVYREAARILRSRVDAGTP